MPDSVNRFDRPAITGRDSPRFELCESDPASAALIEQALDRLAAVGPALGRPLVDTLEHTRLKNLKELRAERRYADSEKGT